MTVIAVIISVAIGFYAIYHKVASGKHGHSSHDHTQDEHLSDLTRDDLENYRAFLRSLLMHAGIGDRTWRCHDHGWRTQNLIIADQASLAFW
ncbi:hypothetical protein P4S72_20955 [Vibrio sp. PP-XX7]